MYEGSLCVSCMSTDDLIELFVSRTVDNAEENYAKMLTSCLNIQISETDGHDSICENCVSKLRDCVSFKTQTLKTVSILSSVDITQLLTLEDIEVLGLQETKEVPEAEESQYDVLDREKTCLEKDLNGNIDEISPEARVISKHKKRKVGRPRLDTRDNVPYKIGKDEMTCRECGMVFANNVTLKIHLNTHFGSHACRSCHKRFITRQSLKRHETTHLAGPFACDACHQEFHSLNTLRSHKRYKHGKTTPYPCRDCAAGFATFQQRLNHEATAHGRTERRYRCSYCDRCFSHSGQRARHVSDRHEVKRFPCPLCGLQFRRAYVRAHLLRVHGAGRGHACPACARRHPTRSALAKHMRSHLNDRRFVCKLCGKAFVQKCSLKYHIGSHVRRGEYRGDPDFLVLYIDNSKAKHTGLLSDKDEEQYLDESLLSDQSAEDLSIEIHSIELTDTIDCIDGMLLDDERLKLPSDLDVS